MHYMGKNCAWGLRSSPSEFPAAGGGIGWRSGLPRARALAYGSNHHPQARTKETTTELVSLVSCSRVECVYHILLRRSMTRCGAGAAAHSSSAHVASKAQTPPTRSQTPPTRSLSQTPPTMQPPVHAWCHGPCVFHAIDAASPVMNCPLLDDDN
jgi:hypothetical protein